GHPTEVFTFGTRVTRVTEVLGAGSFAGVMRAVFQSIADLGGGTRIGAALHEINVLEGEARAGRGGRPAVVIVSDGLDQGDAAQLRREMVLLSSRAEPLFWLNPLLATPGYRPLAYGMATALPYIDRFLPLGSLDDLRRCVQEL